MIGWSKKTQIAIEEILNFNDNRDIVIIDELAKTPMVHAHVHYIQGHPTDSNTLMQANVGEAEAAIIFADERIDDASLIDGKSLLVASTIESMAPLVHTTVEIMQEKHIKNFNHIHVNDFILSQEMISRLAVRSAVSKGITGLYSQLISREHGDDLYEIKKRQEWKSYRDAFNALLQEGATLIADHQNLGINRMLDKEIPADAKLYVICDQFTYQRITKKAL
jgi:voltage-gated potassium channel